MKPVKQKKQKKNINVNKLVSSLDTNTTLEEALKVIQYYILDPKHSCKYSSLTYVDEVTLLCLLKDVDVTLKDFEYYIDDVNVSCSIDKLIEAGYVDYETLTPNKVILRRLYFSHPFAKDFTVLDERDLRHFSDYYIIEEFEQARSKWMGKEWIKTIYKSLELDRFKNERISFTTFINIAANKTRVHTPNEKTALRCHTFDFNVQRLEILTSVLFKEIKELLN